MGGWAQLLRAPPPGHNGKPTTPTVGSNSEGGTTGCSLCPAPPAVRLREREREAGGGGGGEAASSSASWPSRSGRLGWRRRSRRRRWLVGDQEEARPGQADGAAAEAGCEARPGQARLAARRALRECGAKRAQRPRLPARLGSASAAS